MNDDVQVTVYMKCKSCGNDRLAVGISTNKELMIGCEYCGVVLALIDQWPKQDLLDSAACDCEECTMKRQESLN
jgi:uncharacterized Zn finger protein